MEVTSNASQPNKNYRLECGQKIIDFEEAAERLGSQRRAAECTGIARSTYQHLYNREQKFEMSEVTLQFFRTADGVSFLHRLTLSIEFVISHICGSGIGAIQWIYELSQLDKIVASSDGSICERLQTLETGIVEFGATQFVDLSKKMPKKSIACALDETFPSDICLVGIEPVSNFILTELFAQKRDSATWEQAMKEVLDALPVEVIQVVSDEAKALIKYCRDCLEAHHSPDLFHIQQEISKATSAPMRARLKSAQAIFNNATDVLLGEWEHKNEVEALEVKAVGRPINFDQRLGTHALEHQECLEALTATANQAQSIRDANKGIGDDYHPFNLNDGSPKTPEKLRAELDARFETIQTHANDAELSENGHKKINKAKKVTDSMVATLSFFWSWVATEVERLKLTQAGVHLFREVLVLIAYLEFHIPKSRNAEEKLHRQKLYDTTMQILESNESWNAASTEQQNALMASAKRCASVFQRSSSCVEGRNGQLSLMHHSRRAISQRRLSSLTVVHNYFIRRPDNTTAAERFFEQKHEDLFLWLLDRVDCPPLPAKKGVDRRGLKQVA